MNLSSRGLVAVTSSLLLAAFTTSGAAEKGEHWVGSWATASTKYVPSGQSAQAPSFDDSTLRQVLHLSLGGKRLRVKFSNAFGSKGLKIASAHVAVATGGSAIRSGTDKPLLFDGQTSIIIPARAVMVSDPVDLEVAPLSALAVSTHIQSTPPEITVHSDSRATSYLQPGDAVSEADLSKATAIVHWYFLGGVDVAADRASAAVVTLGDSITDGAKSTTDKNARWPDILARRLKDNKHTSDVGVLNAGIGGNRLLQNGAGDNALARLDRDVLAQSGARWVIVLEGINDLGNRAAAQARGEDAPTREALINAFEQIIIRAHARNMLVYGATILPFEGAKYFSQDAEADRQAINQWIRTSGKFDGVIDLEAATRDAQSPTHLARAADSGDHLHPADEGYGLMGNAIDLKLFSK